MGYNARKDTILRTLTALSSVLRLHGMSLPEKDGAHAALEVYRAAESSQTSKP
jgi:aspartate aminotransferase-like enzyme